MSRQRRELPSIPRPGENSKYIDAYASMSRKKGIFSIGTTILMVVVLLMTFFIPIMKFDFSVVDDNGQKFEYNVSVANVVDNWMHSGSVGDGNYSYNNYNDMENIRSSHETLKFYEENDRSIQADVEMIKEQSVNALQAYRRALNYKDAYVSVIETETREFVEHMSGDDILVLAEEYGYTNPSSMNSAVDFLVKKLTETPKEQCEVLFDTFAADIECGNYDGLAVFMNKAYGVSESEISKLAEKYLVGEYTVDGEFVKTVEKINDGIGYIPDSRLVSTDLGLNSSALMLAILLVLSQLVLAVITVCSIFLECIKSMLVLGKKVEIASASMLIAVLLPLYIIIPAIVCQGFKLTDVEYQMINTVPMIIVTVVSIVAVIVLKKICNKGFSELKENIETEK